MPQLEEDEWPKPGQPTTAETDHAKDEDEEPERDGVRSEYPPTLPPEALPTKD
jgi:hypothetical protein